MNGSGHAVAHYARGHVGRAGPMALRIALAGLDRHVADRNLVDAAWTAAGVAVAIGEVFDEARAIGGRAIVDVTFALHARLGLSHAAPPTPFIELIALDPYMEWLAPRLEAGAPWRPILARWIETINERLTLHRYGTPAQRRIHAQDLIGAPLAALLEPTAALLELADPMLAFQDLIDADRFGARGWNRIDLPDANRIGGFYGLSDEVRPPSPEHIGAVAARTAEQLAPYAAAPFPPHIQAWVRATIGLVREALLRRAAEGAWPEWPVAEPGWLDRLQSWIRGGK